MQVISVPKCTHLLSLDKPLLSSGLKGISGPTARDVVTSMPHTFTYSEHYSIKHYSVKRGRPVQRKGHSCFD